MSQKEKDLINGYIRQIENTLIFHTIIPLSINHICFEYYHSTNIIYLFAALRGYSCHGLYAYNLDDKTKWKYKIYDIYDTKLKTIVDPARIGCTSAFMAKNIKLPPKITKKICNLYSNKTTKNSTFNVIFKCGGHDSEDSNQCHATIFDPFQFNIYNDSETELRAFNWKLASLPFSQWGTNTIYSDLYGIYCIGGNCDKIYNLGLNDYDEDNNNNWNWKCVARMNGSIRYVSSVMIDKNKLLICGGLHGNNSLRKSQILNLEDYTFNDIADCQMSHNQAPIYYDEINKKIYLGSGDTAGYLGRVGFEYYDIHKQKWFDEEISNTNVQHDFYPLLWSSDGGNNILNIAQEQMEFIDLRAAHCGWIVINTKLCSAGSKFNDTSQSEHFFDTSTPVNMSSWLLY